LPGSARPVRIVRTPESDRPTRASAFDHGLAPRQTTQPATQSRFGDWTWEHDLAMETQKDGFLDTVPGPLLQVHRTGQGVRCASFLCIIAYGRTSSMNRRTIGLLLGLLVVAAACRRASSDEKTLYRKASPYATLVVTEDEQGLRTLRFGDDPNAQSIVKVGDPDHVECEYLQV